jgi:hypothetical protein
MEKITITMSLEPTPSNLAKLAALCGVETSEVSAPVTTVENEPVHEIMEVSPLVDAAPVKTYTKADVKAVCLALSKEGKQAVLKEAFAKFGAKKFTEIAEADYPALMKELGHE